MRRPRSSFLISLPERTIRALAAVLGGTLHETATLLLPRLVRRSRLYEATAKNALRIAIELVGGVEGSPTAEDAETPGRLAVRKGAGNVVEIGSIAAFGFSPLWLLAGASDILHGSRVYLDAFVGELKSAGVLQDDAEVGSVDDLLGMLERSSAWAAGMIDIPPLELEELRRSLQELLEDAGSLPSPSELADLYRGLEQIAIDERRTLLEVSTGVGLAFLLSARNVARDELAVPYRQDWRPFRDEGFGAYSRRVASPYARAVSSHFDPAQPSWTERLLALIRR